MKADAAVITFRPVTDVDLPMLRRWMALPHWRQWWGEPETELGYIRDMIAGRDSTRPFLFCVDGVPAGYIQYWFIADHQCEPWVTDEPWVADLPREAIGVDMSIGEPDRLGKGLGSAVLATFVRTLRDEGFCDIIIDPHPDNARAVRAYEKAGFTPIPEMAGKHDEVLLMRYMPDPQPMETGET